MSPTDNSFFFAFYFYLYSFSFYFQFNFQFNYITLFRLIAENESLRHRNTILENESLNVVRRGGRSNVRTYAMSDTHTNTVELSQGAGAGVVGVGVGVGVGFPQHYEYESQYQSQSQCQYPHNEYKCKSDGLRRGASGSGSVTALQVNPDSYPNTDSNTDSMRIPSLKLVTRLKQAVSEREAYRQVT